MAVSSTPQPAPAPTVKAGPISYLFIGFIILCVFCVVCSGMINLAQRVGFLPTPKPTQTQVINLNVVQTSAVATYQANSGEVPSPTPRSTKVRVFPGISPTPNTVPSETPIPIIPPTSTPPQPETNPQQGLIQPGTYLVNTDIQPGIYKGLAGADMHKSCYWARLKSLSGNLDALLANENAIGQFYIEIKSDDYALQARCPIRLVSPLPPHTGDYPQSLQPGTYLVGIDIQPGTYKGQAGNDITASCYWARLSNVAGNMDALIANDNPTGQFYVAVSADDFAITTRCALERAGD
jgi:hypothetical protein